MNAQNEAILAASTSAGNPRGVGHGSAWLMFEPDNLNQFRFRYLGREKLARKHRIRLCCNFRADSGARGHATSEISMRLAIRVLISCRAWYGSSPSIFQMIRVADRPAGSADGVS